MCPVLNQFVTRRCPFSGTARGVDRQGHRNLSRLAAGTDAQPSFLDSRFRVTRDSERQVNRFCFAACPIPFAHRSQRLIDPKGRFANHVLGGGLIGRYGAARRPGILRHVHVNQLVDLGRRLSFEFVIQRCPCTQTTQEDLKSCSTAARHVELGRFQRRSGHGCVGVQPLIRTDDVVLKRLGLGRASLQSSQAD